ncbi:unannotated protein [freshwater metagenome]|uniref:Unannotated protein n=1 Tax=freshwater metagenome TaxID=449393 RepID=A0A6J7ALW5_9ZZZZ
MHVLRTVGDVVRAVGREPLRDHQIFGRVEPAREPPHGRARCESDGLDIDIGVGEALGDRLERGDRPSELLAGARVVGGESKLRLGDPYLHGAHHADQAFVQPAQHGGAFGDRAEQLRRGAFEVDLVHGFLARRHAANHGDTGDLRVEKEHRWALRRAGCDEDALRVLGELDHDLDSRERPRAGGLGGGHVRVLDIVVAVLLQRRCQHDRTVGHAGQPGFALAERAELINRERRAHRGYQRKRGRGTALCLEHLTELDEPHAATAHVFA